MNDSKPNHESTGSAGSANQLRPLPANWRWARLNEVCTKVQDGTHFSPKEQSRTGVFKYITAKNIKHWGLDLSTVTYLSESVHREIYKRCNPEKGDVLYIKDGVTTGVATVNSLDEEFSLLSSVALLKPRRDVLDPRFLMYYLNSSDGYRVMTGQMTGTAIKRLILQKIKESFVPVAPLDEQRRIVAEIEKQFTRLEAGVADLRRVQVNLKRYRAAVLKAACEGKLVPTEASHWATTTLGTVITKIEAGKSFRCEERPPNNREVGVVKVSAVTWGTFDEKETKTCLDTSRIDERYFIRPGDFLFSRANTIELVGACVIALTVTLKLMLSDKILRFRFAESIMPRWVLYWLRSEFGRREIERLSTGNQESMRNIGQDRIRQISIAVPPFVGQQRIVAEVERRLSVVEELEAVVNANLQRATRLRQSILQRAFEGKFAPRYD